MSSMSEESLVGFKLPVASYQFPEKTRLVCGDCGDCDCENGFARKGRIVVGVVVVVGRGLSETYKLIICEKCGTGGDGFCAEFACWEAAWA